MWGTLPVKLLVCISFFTPHPWAAHLLHVPVSISSQGCCWAGGVPRLCSPPPTAAGLRQLPAWAPTSLSLGSGEVLPVPLPLPACAVLSPCLQCTAPETLNSSAQLQLQSCVNSHQERAGARD